MTEHVVRDVVASAALDGHEVDDDWVGVLHRIANGELTADDAVHLLRERAGVEVAERRLEDMRVFLARLLGYPEPHGSALTDVFLLEQVASFVRQGMRSPSADLQREQWTSHYPRRCSQCGQRWADRACGPTHAVIAEDLGLGDLRRELAELRARNGGIGG